MKQAANLSTDGSKFTEMNDKPIKIQCLKKVYVFYEFFSLLYKMKTGEIEILIINQL